MEIRAMKLSQGPPGDCDFPDVEIDPDDLPVCGAQLQDGREQAVAAAEVEDVAPGRDVGRDPKNRTHAELEVQI